jgi:hypothetical protein
MPTQKQIDANRHNALRSTGPKTQAGKAISSRNALTHGLRARTALLPGEDKDAFLRLFKAFRAEYRPIGRFQEALVEQIIVAYWKLSRLIRIETHVYHEKSTDDTSFRNLRKLYLHRHDEPDSEPPKPRLNPDQLLALAFMRDNSGGNTFSRLSYYEMRLERPFLRAHRELQRLRCSP